jgi:hypothetical protein
MAHEIPLVKVDLLAKLKKVAKLARSGGVTYETNQILPILNEATIDIRDHIADWHAQQAQQLQCICDELKNIRKKMPPREV